MLRTYNSHFPALLGSLTETKYKDFEGEITMTVVEACIMSLGLGGSSTVVMRDMSVEFETSIELMYALKIVCLK